MTAPRALLALLIPLLGVDALHAQSGGEGFLFRRPSIAISAHGGFAQPAAASDIFAFAEEQLTLSRSDFNGWVGGGSVLVMVNPRLEVGASAAYAGRISESEFRDWVGTDDLPVEQETEFVRVPVLATARLNLLPVGRQVGSFAWVPAPVVPYVSAGVGAIWYRFRQVGEFVDVADLSIFYDELDSDGWTPAAQVGGGVDLTLSRRIALTAQGSYLWGSADLQRDFVDFDPIDLSGFTAALGLSLRL